MPEYRKPLEYRFKDGVKYGPGQVEAYPHKIKTSTSSNGLTKYLTILWTDDITTCDCPGWTIRKKDKDGNPKPRTCKHCKVAIAHNYADMMHIDDYTPASTAPSRRSQLGAIPERAARNVRIRRRTSDGVE